MLHSLFKIASNFHLNEFSRCLSSGLKINSLKSHPGRRKKKIRLGRGEGSGRGNSSTRGMKGAGQRGTRPPIGFEGGQFPFYRMAPIMGRQPLNAPNYNELNLNQLKYFIESGKINPSKTLTIAEMIKVDIISSIKDGVILLGSGKENYRSKLKIEVTKASPSAIEAVRNAGGSIKAVYISRTNLTKYYRFFKKYPLKSVEDFLKTLPESESRTISQLMRECKVLSPVSFPPERLMRIYCNEALAGFMCYLNLNQSPREPLIKALNS